MEKAGGKKRLMQILDSGSIWLILAYVVVMPVESLKGLPEYAYSVLKYFDMTLTTLFVLEYALRVAFTERRRAYIFSFYGLVDFFAIFPTLVLPIAGLQELRAVRLLRLFRVVKAARYSIAIQRFSKALLDAREELVIYLAAIAVVMYISSVGIYHFEHEAQPEVFQSVFHAWWWAVCTLTTVGYGDIYPVTTGGRLFTSVVALLSLGIVAVPAGIMASALSKVKSGE